MLSNNGICRSAFKTLAGLTYGYTINKSRSDCLVCHYVSQTCHYVMRYRNHRHSVRAVLAAVDQRDRRGYTRS